MRTNDDTTNVKGDDTVAKKLPDFETDEEFAEFFDSHSSADYWDEFETIEDVEIKRPANKKISR